MTNFYGIDYVSAQFELLDTLWIGLTNDVATLIKESCGTYPSGWDQVKCRKLAETVENGIRTLKERYDGEPCKAAIRVLTDILEGCRRHPDAHICIVVG